MSVGPIPDITGGLTTGAAGSLADPNLYTNYGPPRIPPGDPGPSACIPVPHCCPDRCRQWSEKHGCCPGGPSICGTPSGGGVMPSWPSGLCACGEQCQTCAKPCLCCCPPDAGGGGGSGGPGAMRFVLLFPNASRPQPPIFSLSANTFAPPHVAPPGLNTAPP